MTVRFLVPASEELMQAMHYYEHQRIGLGREFLIEIEQVLDLISLFPLSWPIYKGDLRRALVKRFPFGLFYRVSRKEIVVAAVMDLRRDPDTFGGCD